MAYKMCNRSDPGPFWAKSHIPTRESRDFTHHAVWVMAVTLFGDIPGRDPVPRTRSQNVTFITRGGDPHRFHAIVQEV